MMKYIFVSHVLIKYYNTVVELYIVLNYVIIYTLNLLGNCE
jgi:hypothetical protein